MHALNTILFFLKNAYYVSPIIRSSLLCVLFTFFVLCILVLCVFIIKKKDHFQLGSIALLILVTLEFVCSCCAMVPFLDGRTEYASPQLVAAVECPPDMIVQGVYCEYEFTKWPFRISSYNDGYQYCPFWIQEFEEARRHMDDMENYTYIISFGHKIDSVSWNVWDSTQMLPLPWGCHVMNPDISFAQDAQNYFYVYRIEKVLIECCG